MARMPSRRSSNEVVQLILGSPAASTEVDDPEERALWFKSPERRRSAYAGRLVLLAVAAAFVIAFVPQWRESIAAASGLDSLQVEVLMTGMAFTILSIAVQYQRQLRDAHADNHRVAKARLALENVDGAISADGVGMSVSHLWTATEKRLEYYHTVVLAQARQSFRNAQVAMSIGFLVLTGAAVVALISTSSTKSAISAGLGVIGASSATYIGRTFIKSQDAAAVHLSKYFEHPRQLSAYLAAERLVEKLSPESRDAAVAKLIDAILASPDLAQPTANNSARRPGRKRSSVQSNAADVKASTE
jgi:hypothetical protein